jgi:anti-sigma factor RsiW
VIERLRTLTTPRRHPRPRELSRYLDGELDPSRREALESHIDGCDRCRRLLVSLQTMLHELGSLRGQAPAGLVDSIIEALRADSPELDAHRPPRGGTESPTPTVVPESGGTSVGDRGLPRWRRGIAVGLAWCLQRRQLRLTLPISIVAGVVLSLVNMGGMLMHGKIDLGVCVSCAMDFLVPFLALNLGLLMLLWVPRSRRPPV